MAEKRQIVGGGELVDNPGHWFIKVRIDSETGEWRFLRKPDGTFWNIEAVHIFPPGGGNVRVDVGDQIRDEKVVSRCEAHFEQLQIKLAEAEKRSSATDQSELLRAQLSQKSGCIVHVEWNADLRCYRYYFEKSEDREWRYILDIYQGDVQEQTANELLDHLERAKWLQVLEQYAGKKLPFFMDKKFVHETAFHPWPT